MKLFVWEYVTGGGGLGSPLPASLIAEAAMMLHAVVRDCADIPGVSVTVAWDRRCGPRPAQAATAVHDVAGDAPPWDVWRDLLTEADAVWPIAPESGGVLERVTEMIEERGKTLLASRSDAVAIAASKSATARRLAACGVPIVPTIDPSRVASEFGVDVPSFDVSPHPTLPPKRGRASEGVALNHPPPLAAEGRGGGNAREDGPHLPLPLAGEGRGEGASFLNSLLSSAAGNERPSPQPSPASGGGSRSSYVVKPDDGAGCDDTWFLADEAALREWATHRRGGDTTIIQPYVLGDALSVSALMRDGEAWVLSCNRQHVVRGADGRFAYRGGIVGGAEDRRAALEPIAAAVARALPGLWGHVGIDLIDSSDHGPVVVDVNPRLTTSYVGLRESIGANPAALLLSLAEQPLAALRRPLAARPVKIAVRPA
jgi:predicted ATP-grasp superfamily ATP-dependent carboligase